MEMTVISHEQMQQAPQVPQQMRAITRGERAAIAAWTLTGWASAQRQSLPVLRGQDLALIVTPPVKDALAIKATNALQMPLGVVRVKEACGQVFLVAFEAAREQRDPELPMLLQPMGRKFERAYQRFAQQVASFSPHLFEYGKWWEEAKRRCDKALKALETDPALASLSVEEAAYFVLKLQMPLAFPGGAQDRQGW